MPNEMESMHQEMDAYLSKGRETEAAEETSAPEGVTVEVPAAVEAAKKNSKKAKKAPVAAATALLPNVSDVPVPTGGVGVLLFLILLIVFAIMPAPGQDGMSRLMLLWKAFIGQASLGNKAPKAAAKGAPSLTQQWAPGANLPAIGNTQSGTWGNQWGGSTY